MDLANIIALGFTGVTTVVSITSWNILLQARVNGHDKLFEERKSQADERHDDVKARLVRIEGKLDQTLTGGKK